MSRRQIFRHTSDTFWPPGLLPNVSLSSVCLPEFSERTLPNTGHTEICPFCHGLQPRDFLIQLFVRNFASTLGRDKASYPCGSPCETSTRWMFQKGLFCPSAFRKSGSWKIQINFSNSTNFFLWRGAIVKECFFKSLDYFQEKSSFYHVEAFPCYSKKSNSTVSISSILDMAECYGQYT